MSETCTPTVNLYSLMDRELERTHDLLKTALTTEAAGAQTDNYLYNRLSVRIYDRVCKMQDVILAAVATHDKEIQEKVAELALMDSNLISEIK